MSFERRLLSRFPRSSRRTRAWPSSSSDSASKYAKVATQAVTYNENVYGLPYSIENSAMVGNTALAATAVKTFDDVITSAKAAVASGKAKYPFLLGLDPKQGDPDHLDPLQTSFGSSVFAQKSDGSYDGSKLTLGDPAGVEFAAALKAWGAEGIQNPNITPDIAATSFAQGESAFFISGPWNIGAIKKASVTYAIDPLPTAWPDAEKPFLISLITSLAIVFLGAMAAYASSRMRFLGRRIGLLALILIQMFPQFLAVVALFLLLSAIGEVVLALGLGTRLGPIFVYLGGAFAVNTYLVYGFFSTVPISIDEAAKIDGGSHAQIFFGIILRLVAPILAVVGLLSFIAPMGEYVLASIMLTDPSRQTLAVGLYSFVSQAFSNNWSIFAAGAVLAEVPVMFLLLHKYIVGGLTAGSVK